MLVIFIKSCFALCVEDLCHIPLWDLTFLFQHLMFWYLSNLKYVFSHFFTSYSWQLLMVWLKFWVSSGCRVLDLNTYRMTQSSCTPNLVWCLPGIQSCVYLPPHVNYAAQAAFNISHWERKTREPFGTTQPLLSSPWPRGTCTKKEFFSPTPSHWLEEWSFLCI